MARYELLEYSFAEEQIDFADRFDWEEIESYETLPNRPYARRSAISECLMFLEFAHIELPAKPQDVERVRDSGLRIVNDYFFGNWVEGDYVDYRDPKCKSLRWIDEYLAGVVLALLGKDRVAIDRLHNFITDGLNFDSGSQELTPQDNYFVILLAFHLSGRSTPLQEELVLSIRDARGKRAKLLLDCLEKLIANDGSGFSHAVARYLKRFLKVEKDVTGPFFSGEATIMWHAAQEQGLELGVLSEKQMALIMTRETIGLTSATS